MDDVISMCKEQATQAMHGFSTPRSHGRADLEPDTDGQVRHTRFRGALCRIQRRLRFYHQCRQVPGQRREFLGPIESTIKSITTVEQAETVLRKGITAVRRPRHVRVDQIGAMIDTPQGLTPFTFLMTIPANHLYGHAAQMN